MKKTFCASFSLLAAFSVAVACAVVAANAANHTTMIHQQSQDPAPQTQTVSGKITAVEKSSFSIAIATAKNSNPGRQLTEQGGSPQAMTFTVDKNTTVDGKLKVGASADVTYRQESGNNIAISVHVVQ